MDASSLNPKVLNCHAVVDAGVETPQALDVSHLIQVS